MNTEITIPDHYDPGAIITKDSNPLKEFKIWKDFALNGGYDWKGDEFTLQDFEDYIDQLKEDHLTNNQD